MALPPILIETGGSLVAILALAGLAWWMKLGGAPLLQDEAAVHRAAGEISDGFEVAKYEISRDRTAAVVQDCSNQIMVIRRHGNRFVGRILGASAIAQANETTLEIDCGERTFGVVKLEIGDGSAWAEAINRVGNAGHA